MHRAIEIDQKLAAGLPRDASSVQLDGATRALAPVIHSLDCGVAAPTKNENGVRETQASKDGKARHGAVSPDRKVKLIMNHPTKRLRESIRDGQVNRSSPHASCTNTSPAPIDRQSQQSDLNWIHGENVDWYNRELRKKVCLILQAGRLFTVMRTLLDNRIVESR